MIHQRFFTVVSRDGEDVIKAYLYDHTRIRRIAPGNGGDGTQHYLLVTSADDWDRAGYLAKYQADRLASGLHAPSAVQEIEADAVSEHKFTWGVDLGYQPAHEPPRHR